MNYYGEDYLAHFGVKGQKWGIRRFQNPDGTLTEAGKKHYGIAAQEFKSQAEKDAAQKKFARKVEKEAQKLGSRIKKADREYQMKEAIEYDQKAKNAKRVGRAALAVALPAIGVAGITESSYNAKINQALTNASKTLENDNKWLEVARSELDFNKYPTGNKEIAMVRAMQRNETKKNIVDTLKRAMPQATEAAAAYPIAIGVASISSSVAAVAYGKAAYDRVVATAAKRRISDVGHAKAVERMNKQYNKVVNMVKDTPYKAVLDARVEAYKQEHPGTELSDKQIMKNLM